MANYIKVTEAVARFLKVEDIRNRTADGNYLLWQADVLNFPGDGIMQKTAHCGGVVLTPNAAKEEVDGSSHPAKVRVPEWLCIASEVVTGTDEGVENKEEGIV